MKGFGYFFPYRKVLVLQPKTYTVYRFWLGKCRHVQNYTQALDEKMLQSSSDVLVACPIQDIYKCQAPKLKCLDRSAFLYHTLRHQFKSDAWIASRWLSPTSFISLKFLDLPKLNFDHFQGRIGALLSEIVRCPVFETGEGCLLAPTQLGHIYELYIKNNLLIFMRQIDQSTIASKVLRDTEISAFKRYLERHFQVNPQTLQIKWWGPHAPDDIDVYQTQLLEESLVYNYVCYINPAFGFKHQLSIKWFRYQHSLKRLKIFVYFLLLLGMPFLIESTFDLWKIKHQYQDLLLSMERLQQEHRSYEQTQETDDQIKRYEKQKAILQVVHLLKQQMVGPIPTLKRLSSFVKDQVRCHELIWLRGHIVIDPKDHTLMLKSMTYDDHNTSSQSLVLGITGSSVDTLKTFEKKLQTKLAQNQRLKIWTKPFHAEPSTVDSFQDLDVEKNLASGLLEVTEQP